MLGRLLEQFNTLREVVFDSNKKAADGAAQLRQLLATEVRAFPFHLLESKEVLIWNMSQ